MKRGGTRRRRSKRALLQLRLRCTRIDATERAAGRFGREQRGLLSVHRCNMHAIRVLIIKGALCRHGKCVFMRTRARGDRQRTKRSEKKVKRCLPCV